MTEKDSLWRQAFEDEDLEQRVEAARELMSQGEELTDVLPALIQALQLTTPDENEYWWFHFVMAFSDIKKPVATAIAEKILDSTVPSRQRISLVRYVRELHDNGDIANTSLRKLVDSNEDPELRAWAEVILNRRWRSGFELTDNVLELARDESADTKLRVRALDCLNRAKTNAEQQQAYKETSLAALLSENEEVAKQAGANLHDFDLTAEDWESIYASMAGTFPTSVLYPLQKQPNPPAKIVPDMLRCLNVSEGWADYAQTILARIGEPAVGPLLDLAEDESQEKQVRSNALWSLYRMNSAFINEHQKSRLHSLMNSESQATRVEAAAVLAHFGDTDQVVLEMLMEGLVSEDYEPYIDLAKSVVRELPTDLTVPFMIRKYESLYEADEDSEEALLNEFSETPATLMHFFMDVGSNSEAASRFIVQQLRFAKGLHDANMLQNAVSMVEYPIVPLLIEALEESVAGRAVDETARLIEGMQWRIYRDPDVKKMIAPVAALLKSENEKIVANAREFLEHFPSCQHLLSETEETEPPAEDSNVDETKEALRDLVMAAAAADTLENRIEAGEDSPEVTAELLAMLNRAGEFEYAAYQLSIRENAIEPALAKLREMLAGVHQMEVIEALAWYPAAEPDLAKLLHDDEPTVIDSALQSLEAIGSSDPVTCQRIVELTHHEDESVVNAAVDALGTCRSSAGKERLLELARIARYDDSALAALACYESFPEEAISLLEKKLEDTENSRDLSRIAIARLGDNAVRLLPKLIEVMPLHLAEKYSEEFNTIVAAIADMGAKAESALPEIEKYLRGRRSHYYAAQSIWRISPAHAEALDLADIYDRNNNEANV